MAGPRWKFFDGSTSQEYQFEVNPNSGGTPSRTKNILEQATVAPGGKTLVFEGADEPSKIEFSGTLLSQAQHDALVEWWEKRRQIRLTDDLNRQFWIYITTLDLTRERAIHYPWKHSFKISAILLDVT